MRRDVQENDEEAVRVKEQSILELGTLLAKTGQAAGNVQRHSVYILCLAKTWVLFQKTVSVNSESRLKLGIDLLQHEKS